MCVLALSMTIFDINQTNTSYKLRTHKNQFVHRLIAVYTYFYTTACSVVKLNPTRKTPFYINFAHSKGARAAKYTSPVKVQNIVI